MTEAKKELIKKAIHVYDCLKYFKMAINESVKVKEAPHALYLIGGTMEDLQPIFNELTEVIEGMMCQTATDETKAITNI